VTGDPPTTFDELVRAVARVDVAHGVAAGVVLGETYEIVERVGNGGMGVVFRAHDRRLGRDVAVKLLRRTGDGDLRRLFEREARATAQLLHPNIVTLHHVGEHDGQPYLVLELLTGETLATRLTRRVRLPQAEALAIADAVLAAIAFAHQHGVLHRDLKPSNVFLTSDDRIKVLDFGIALSLDAASGPVTRAAGTPGYMAPEQRDGSEQDARTDVWAAARLFVECVTGRRADDDDAIAVLDKLGIDRDVRSALVRSLDPDPEKRPHSAEELRAMLRPAPPRHPGRARLLALAAVAAIATTAAAVAVATRSSAPPPVSAAELAAATFAADQGTFLFRVDSDGTAHGVYTRSDGILVGRFADGTFTGRWCEQPTRRPPLNAGLATLHFLHGVDRLIVDGSWIVGDNRYLPWHAGFLGSEVDAALDPTLVARLERREQCP
jgi:hypothetical protein